MKKSYRLVAGCCLVPLLLAAGYFAGLFEKAPPITDRPAPAPAAAQDPNPIVRLRTVYLVPPLGKVHRIFLGGRLGGEGVIRLDESELKFDVWGNTPEDAVGQLPRHDIQLVAVQTAPGNFQHRALYDIKANPPIDLHLQLVAPSDGGKAAYRLLVLDSLKQITRVITLEQLVPQTNARGFSVGSAS